MTNTLAYVSSSQLLRCNPATHILCYPQCARSLIQYHRRGSQQVQWGGCRCAYGLWLLQVLGFFLLPRMLPGGWAAWLGRAPLPVRAAAGPLLALHDMSTMGNVWLLQVGPAAACRLECSPEGMVQHLRWNDVGALWGAAGSDPSSRMSFDCSTGLN